MTVLVRPATTADAEGVSALYADVVTGTAISFEETPPDAAGIARRMLATPRLPWLVAEVDARVIGYTYASRHRSRAGYRWSAECSVFVDRAYHSQGVGRRLYGALIEEVTGLGYRSLFAGIALPNPTSVRLHEGTGFRPIGVFRNVGYKQGAWRDVGWWQLDLGELTSPPPDPREWSAPN